MSDRLWTVGGNKRFDLSCPLVMAILNATPDSFFAGSRVDNPSDAANAALMAVADGAGMIDVGGESTRPGAPPVAEPEQIDRVVPLIRAIRAALGPDVAISVDTTRASVAQAAIQAGAGVINDVSAGREDPAMLALAARHRTGLIIMHRLVAPAEDSYSDQYPKPPEYADVVGEVRAFLSDRLDAAVAAGVPRDAVVLDPGLGFGKSVEQNLALIRGTHRLRELGRPVVSGVSRKSFVARAAGMGPNTAPTDRLAGSVALSVCHRAWGASVFRVHDAAAHARALSLVPGVGARASA